MDIICARCGRHFSSIEAAREHSGNCKETSKGEPIRWKRARNFKIAPEEWEKLIKLINPQDISLTVTPSSVEPTDSKSTSSKDSTTSEIATPSTDAEDSKESPNEKEAGKDIHKHSSEKTDGYRAQNWLMALLFIFALTIIGCGISISIGNSIPFWLLFGFSAFYSVEKWFLYYTRKYKIVGRLYKLILNLSVLSLLGLIIWSGILLFSQQFMYSPLVDSLVFLAEFVIFIWLCRFVAISKWRQPGMKLTVLSLICLFIIFAFAGVEPLSSYKDKVIAWMSVQLSEVVESPTESKPTEPRLTEEPKTTEESDTMLGQRYPRIADIWDTDKSPFRSKVMMITLETTSETAPGYYYITLRSGNETFGTREIKWLEDMQAKTFVWYIDSTTTAFAKLMEGIPCVDIFQVDISTTPPIIEPVPSLVAETPKDGQDKIPAEEKEEPQLPSITSSISNLEKLTFELLNAKRVENDVSPTKWDDRLYELSKLHTQKMADRGEIFHSPSGADYGENAWGGRGYYRYSAQELSRVIVDSWMSSPLHRAWLLHEPIREAVVSIVITPDGQYASWSFWINKLGSGPKLVEEIAREWRNTGGGMPWIEWLYMKGYL